MLNIARCLLPAAVVLALLSSAEGASAAAAPKTDPTARELAAQATPTPVAAPAPPAAKPTPVATPAAPPVATPVAAAKPAPEATPAKAKPYAKAHLVTKAKGKGSHAQKAKANVGSKPHGGKTKAAPPPVRPTVSKPVKSARA